MIRERAVDDLRLAEVCHVHKRHAHGIKREEEKVAREPQTDLVMEVGLPQHAYAVLVDGALPRPRPSGVAILERVVVLGQATAHRLVVYCPQRAVVARGGVGGYSPFPHPLLVVGNHRWVYLAQGHGTLGDGERAHGGEIVGHAAVMTFPLVFLRETRGKSMKRDAA